MASARPTAWCWTCWNSLSLVLRFRRISDHPDGEIVKIYYEISVLRAPMTSFLVSQYFIVHVIEIWIIWLTFPCEFKIHDFPATVSSKYCDDWNDLSTTTDVYFRKFTSCRVVELSSFLVIFGVSSSWVLELVSPSFSRVCSIPGSEFPVPGKIWCNTF